MDDKLTIQLGEFQNIDSVNVDNYSKVQLENKVSVLTEYDIRNILSVTEVFSAERQQNEIYRVYGGIEYMSLLNNINQQYENLSDFFVDLNFSGSGRRRIIKKSIYDIDFYLVRPTTGYTGIDSSDNTTYLRYFEVIATPNEFELFEAGFSNNIFNEQKYGFSFNEDFDVSPYFDDFGFPITELFLFAFYRTSTNGLGDSELMYFTRWDENTGNPIKTPLGYTTYSIGDRIYGDLISYNKPRFSQEQKTPQAYYIDTFYDSGTTQKTLRWTYNPFIPLKLRYFSNELKRANISGTSYEQVSNIPTWATDVGDGNRVWRSILQQGYIDPLTGDGVDYPFINGKRYLFSNIVLNIVPDLTHPNTGQVFNEIKFGAPSTINYNPTGNINNIGKPCQ